MSIPFALYRIGYFLANSLPLSWCYTIASTLAKCHYSISSKDRNTVISNLRIIYGTSKSGQELASIAKGVFKNFAKYLVDFFRFQKIDNDYIKKYVKIEGLENIDKAVSNGKGVIALSAHFGNWELGAIILSLVRGPLYAVVLTHQDKMINEFFNGQRAIGRVVPIEIGMGLRQCYSALKKNGILALLGDRDFFKNGMPMDFFGQKALIPRGPAAFSCRIGSAVVPCFMIREEGDTFRFVFEEPIYPDGGANEEARIAGIAARYLSKIESYVKRYPDQWYVFKNIWENHEGSMRPDTII